MNSSAGWQQLTVTQLQDEGILLVEDGNHGEYRPRTEEFGANGVFFIRASDMDQGRILFETAARINSIARERIRKGIGAGGDVLLSHKGTVGKIAYAPLDCPKFVCSPQTTFWRSVDHARLDRRYLYYYLCSENFRQQLVSRKGETDMADYVSLTGQRELKVLFPPIDVQRAIARILGTLDDKIELNRRMNRTLEAMAQALFKSWFVDFDPVIAKREGRKPFGMDDATAALFPEHFQETAMGPIPKGWRYRAAETVADIGIGKTPPRKEPQWFTRNLNDIRWVSIRDMGDEGQYIFDTSEYLVSDAVDRFNIRVVPDNTVLLSFKLTIGRVAITDGDMTTNEAIAHFKMPEDALVSTEYLYLYLKEYPWGQLGTTSSIAEAVNSKIVKKIPVLVPESAIVDVFTDNVAKVFKRIKNNQCQKRTLSRIRDTLLPKLLSGEIRVRQAEKAVEEAI